MKKIINYLNETIKKEKQIVIFMIIIFLVGLIAGSLFINLVSQGDKDILTNQVATFFTSIKKLSSDVFGVNALFDGLLNNYSQLFIIFVLGISMVGVIAVVFILFFKGFTLGTTLSAIILKYQLKGVLGVFLYVFPVVIINILIYIFISFFATNASIKFLKALLKKDNLNFKKFLGKYLLSFIISIIFMFICCLLDAFLTPILLKLFTFII